MPRPDLHVFVCTQARAEGHPRGSCSAHGAARVYQAFATQMTIKKLIGKVALNQTGCLGPCQDGTNVLVYPEGVLYSNISAEDVSRIVDEHLISGTPVSEKVASAEVW